MCGIVGYIGDRNAGPILMNSLSRLEYRGYDSSGILLCEKSNPEFWLKKTTKRISDLKKLCEGHPHSNMGIAHTRWATHGKVSIENAHPHVSFSGKIALVHNGVVDNFKELKDMLKKGNVELKSETDTELIVQLIDLKYQISGNIENSIIQTLRKVDGTYGLVITCKDTPDKIYVARNGSPIVIGIDENQTIVASDPEAIVGHTKTLVYLKDGEFAVLEANNMVLTSINDNSPQDIEIVNYSLEEKQYSKENYSHYMLKEINEQPESIERCIRGRIHGNEVVLGGLKQTLTESMYGIKEVYTLGCGTAYHAGMINSMHFEYLAGTHSTPILCTDFISRYPIVNKENSLYLAYSQSGETADTIKATKEIINKGGTVAGIVNSVGSTLSRLCNQGVYIHAGAEGAVASTKSFTSQVTSGLLLSIMLGRKKILTENESEKLLEGLKKIPEKIKNYLENPGPVKEVVKTMVKAKYVFYLGRGFSYPIAMEGALKFKELVYVPCGGYHAGEMKHGPIALIENNTPVIGIIPNDSQRNKMLTNLKEAKARGAHIITIHSSGDKEISDFSNVSIEIPEVEECLSPLLTAIPVQLLSYYGALELGFDVDKPRNLAKSVTVE